MKKQNIIKTIPLLFSVFTGNAYAASLSVDMISGGSIDNASSSNIGSSFNIDIILNDVADFAGFEFDLGFNSAIVNATSITSGNIFGLDTFSLENQINASSIGFSETTLAFSGLDPLSPTVLATISFDVVGAGTDTLSLSNAILSDSFGLGISPVTLTNGDISVASTSPSAVPVPGALILMFSGLVGVFTTIGKRKQTVGV